MAAEIMSNSMAGHAANPSGNRLNHGHQRKAEQHRPSKAVTKLSPDLAIGSDAARVVVGSAGNEPRPQVFEESDRL